MAERIINSKAALEGERKQVTVLFADLKGSMELLADRDPEEARKLLDPVLEHMMEAVHRYEGTVNQVMGDGIMALFGAPLAHEDHAVRACYAALRMQESVKRYAEGVFRRYGVPIEIRVGLNSGEVVVRAIGSDLHMDYTAVGQTTHLAARMEQLAGPQTIQLTPDTLALAEGFVQATSRGLVPVKGLASPIEVYELTGASPVRSRLHAAAARGLTRFVGRDAEIELLRTGLGRAGQGRGQVIAIVGEPGVGKSRLVWEFTHSHRSQGWLVLETAAVSYAQATAYFPVIELLRNYFGIEPRDDDRRRREKITGKLLSLDRALEPSLPVFFSLLDVPVGDHEWTTLDPLQRRRQTLDALKRHVLRESQEQPILLVVEDLHWIDSETQAWLDLIVESLPSARLVLLLNYRPEYQHGWMGKTYYNQVRLDPLPLSGAEELLEGLVGIDPALHDLRQTLIARTQGNPFFLEESVRTLVETRVLTGERGAYRLTGSIQALQLPTTAQAVLAARIDRLPPGDKQLLQSAAVIGKDVPYALLEAVVEDAQEVLRSGLERLRAAEFLYEARLFPQLEYTFKHGLTHEVAYAGLLHGRRRELHARITDAIERLAPERLAEVAERLAHHALRGELWEKAASYLRIAAVRAMARAANREAIKHLEQALDALRQMPENRETTELTIDIHVSLRDALLPLGELARMGSHLYEAARLARLIGDRPRLVAVTSRLAHQGVFSGDYEEGVRFGEEAVSVATSLGDHWLEGSAVVALSSPYLARGEFRAAAALLERQLVLADVPQPARAPGSLLVSGLANAWLAEALSELGRFEEAVTYGETAVRIAEEAEHPFTLFNGLIHLGLVHLRCGTYRRAVEVFKRGHDLCGALQIEVGAPFISAYLGTAYAFAGRHDDAVPLIKSALERFRSREQFHAWPAIIVLCAATSFLLAGHTKEAAVCAGDALEVSRRFGGRGAEAHALRLSGDVAAATGAAGAETYYREALQLAEDRHMRPIVAHCHLGLGRLFNRTGRREVAQEHLSTARTMYREMGMTYWLEKAEGEIAPS